MVKIKYYRLVVFAMLLMVSNACTRKLMDHVVFQIKPSHSTPASVGLAYQQIQIGSPKRKVMAWKVTANSDKVVILFKGLGESMSDWVYPQKLLYDENISSVSFNYGPLSDTTGNKGSSRFSEVSNDVLALMDTIRNKQPNAEIYFLGHSVGNAVMLQILRKQKNLLVKGVIICNAFSSIRNWAVYHKRFPRLFKFVIPAYYDNVKSIRKIDTPILVVHSKDDKVNPYFMGLEVFHASHSLKEMQTFSGYQHNDMYQKKNTTYWEPIFIFLKK